MAAAPELEIQAFPDAAAFDAWLTHEHDRSPGCRLRLTKKGAGVPSVSYAEAVEIALCHGWIDGRIDRLYLVRFTAPNPTVRSERIAAAVRKLADM